EVGIALGMYQVRTVDMATAYATLADNGTRHVRHFVRKVESSTGEVLYEFTDKEEPAFSEDPSESAKIARNVTESMLGVADYSKLSLKADKRGKKRQVASKTGTHQYADTSQNSKAWMVGYTPQISAAVWVGADQMQPIKWKDSQGNLRDVYGKDLP